MDKNTLIAIVLIFLIWSFWPGLAKKPTLPPAPTATSGLTTMTPALAVTAPGGAQVIPPKVGLIAKPEIKHVLENEVIRLTFSSTQAAVNDVVLKNYRKSREAQAENVDLQSARPGEFLFAMFLAGEDGALKSLSGFEQIEATPNRVVYALEQPGAFRVERSFELLPNSYELAASVRIVNHSGALLREQPALAWSVENRGMSRASKESESSTAHPSLALLADQKLVRPKISLEERQDLAGSLQWAALGNHYFLMAVIPGWEGGSKLETWASPSINPEKEKDRIVDQRLYAPQSKIETGQTMDYQYKIFIGPKELRVLEATGSNLKRSMDLGYFEKFALFLLRLLQFFHKGLGNWGLAIIALTLVVKIVFFPLSHKSFKSMKEMQKIQPLLAEVKEKYKDDKDQLNAKTLEIMKKHKVNPMGGCLPMLVQLPIYFALYQVFYHAIELRHAPFYGWIQDLSAPDRFFVLPVLLGVSMFLQQKLSPKPPDSVQAQMMMIMPIMFAGFMLFLPSGLVIYIFCNTILSVAQQWYINRSLEPKNGLVPQTT